MIHRLLLQEYYGHSIRNGLNHAKIAVSSNNKKNQLYFNLSENVCWVLVVFYVIT